MIVIGDVHGEYDTLIRLLDKLPQTDNLCFVGDLIDRGLKSKQVVEFVRKNNYKCVLGNHEHMAFTEDLVNTWISNGGWQTIQSYCDEDQEFNYDTIDNFRNHGDYKWIQELPLLIQYKGFLISHSFSWEGEETDAYDIIWGRYFDTDNCSLINIFGHTPVNEVQQIHNKHWMIDTGCTYGNKLSAIDLETMIVYNQDKVLE